MKRPLCSCGKPAGYSLCVLVSTLAVRPRRQKCGRAQLFCAACMRKLANDKCHIADSGVLESLRTAYTALVEISEPLVHPSDNEAQEACIRPGPALVSEGPDKPSGGGS
jgi:hypothetical protein